MATIPTPSLIEQATAILDAATNLQKHLEERRLPQPTFETGGRQDWQDAINHPEILAARSWLIDASNIMLNLVLGPTEMISSLAGPAVSKVDVLRTLDALGVAQAVPTDGSAIAVDDLAAELGVGASPLHRQLRFAYLMGLFHEPREGFVAHTAASAAMAPLSPWVAMRLGPLMSRGAWEVPEALRSSAGSAGSRLRPPVALADRKGRDFWQALEEDDPEGRGMERFSSAMKALLAAHTGNSFAPFVRGFDWKALGEGLVVDVGGGSGHVEVSILDDVPPGIKFLVQDLAANQGPANKMIESHGAAERIKFQAHNFFSPQPQGLEPNAYILSRILHDWQDEDCVKILQGLLPAMTDHGTRLFVYERVLPDHTGHIPNHMEQLMRTQDLLMFTLFGGGERSLSDWEALFKKADERLTIEAVRQSPLSPFSNMEVRLV